MSVTQITSVAQPLNAPSHHLAATLVALYIPSEASSERLFSFMERAFDEQQENSLEDYKEVSVMLQYNNRDQRKVQPRRIQNLSNAPIGGSLYLSRTHTQAPRVLLRCCVLD